MVYMGLAMTALTLRDRVVEALQAAGTTEEMVAGVVGVFGAFGDAPPRRGGRPRHDWRPARAAGRH